MNEEGSTLLGEGDIYYDGLREVSKWVGLVGEGGWRKRLEAV